MEQLFEVGRIEMVESCSYGFGVRRMSLAPLASALFVEVVQDECGGGKQ